MDLQYTFDGTTYKFTVPVVEYNGQYFVNCVYPKNGDDFIPRAVYVNTGEQPQTNSIYNYCPDSKLNPQVPDGTGAPITINPNGAVFLDYLLG